MDHPPFSLEIDVEDEEDDEEELQREKEVSEQLQNIYFVEITFMSSFSFTVFYQQNLKIYVLAMMKTTTTSKKCHVIK